MKNIDSPQYKIAHYTGKSKEEKEAIIKNEFGFHQNKRVARPETKTTLHNIVHGEQEKINNLMPLYNTISHRVASGDAARLDKAHPDHTKKNIITKGWDHVVNGGSRVNELQTQRMLRHQEQAHAAMRDRIRTDRNLNLNHIPSTFDGHPNRPTINPDSHHSSVGQNTIHSSQHQIPHAVDERSPAVNYIKNRQNFRPPDKPKTFSFEGHEDRWTKKGKPAPQNFLGSHYMHETEAVKKTDSPLAKQTHMSEYVQPKETYGSSHSYPSYGSSHSSSHQSARVQAQSPKSGNGSITSERPLLGRAPTFSTSHHPDSGASTSSHQHRTENYRTHLPQSMSPSPHRNEIHSDSSSSGSGSGSRGSPTSQRVSLRDLMRMTDP